MSQINVNRIKDSNEGAPDFPSGVNVGGITSTVTLGVTNLNPTNVNVSGVVTATTLDGNLLATGTPTLGLGVTINTSGVNISGVATAGIVSATTLYGDGSNLTGIALTIAPLNYNPSINDMKVPEATGIGFTFNQGVKAGSGNVTLSLVSVGSTLVENFSVGSSVTYGDSDYGTTVTISPTSSLSQNTVYALSYPSGAFTNLGGDLDYVGTAYTFKTILQEYTLWSWGYNGGTNFSNRGQLGLNDIISRSSPTQIPGITWSEFGANGGGGSEYLKGAVKTDGTLWVWGANDKGGLGQNQALAQKGAVSSPVQVPGTTWSDIAGSSNIMASKTDGTLWAWGQEEQGNLGLNSEGVNRSSPTQIPGTTWPTTFNNGKFSYKGQGFAIKTDGTLWSWGANHYGGLGHNNATFYSSPVQVGSDTTWNTISGTSAQTLATKTDGTAWAWGDNEYGRLGLNQSEPVRYSSPVQIPGTTWSNLVSGGSAAMGVKTDGTLWAWGYNNYGSLGQNNTTKYSSPVQIPGTTWSSFGITWKSNGIFSLKTDNTLWAWGDNEDGNLGLNAPEASAKSSPTQIPGTTWTNVYASSKSVIAQQTLEE